MIIVYSFLLIHGIIMYVVLRNPIGSLFAQLIGVVLSSFYYYNFIREYNTKRLFKTYVNTAFYIAVLAIPMFYLNINLFTPQRLNGILSEPAHYAAIMLPAVYVTLMKKSYFKFIIILITILLSKSSIGYIGLVLILFLPLLKIKYFLKYSFLVFVILGASSYYIYTQWDVYSDENNGNIFVRRLKQTQESLVATNTGEFKKHINLSSYALLSNVFVSKNIFFNYPLGTGLGSYKYEYEKVYPELSPPDYLIKQNLSKINQQDANSLFLRMLADLGIFGLLMISYFFYRSYNLFKKESKVYEQGIFFYLIIKLFREGHYFPPEFYFFVLIFIKDFNDKNITHS
ncbi:O-antigen ligase family protein [Polaribacter atrinae]|nr:O-antigen ligase family protein [Polaribacter atrinae]